MHVCAPCYAGAKDSAIPLVSPRDVHVSLEVCGAGWAMRLWAAGWAPRANLLLALQRRLHVLPLKTWGLDGLRLTIAAIA